MSVIFKWHYMHAHFWALFYVTVGTQVVAFAADETFDVRVKARTTSRPYRLPELPGVPALRPASVGAIQATMSTLSSSYVTHVTLTTTFLSTTTVTSTSVSQTESTSHTLSQIVTASSLAPSRTSVRLIPNSSVQASASMVTSTVSTSNQVTSTSIRGSERTLVTSTTQMVDSTTTDNIATQDPQTIATPATQLHQSSSSLSSTVTLTTYTTITSLDAVSSDQNYSHSDFQPSSSKNSVKYVIIAVVAVWIVFTSCWTLSTKAGRQGGPHAGFVRVVHNSIHDRDDVSLLHVLPYEDDLEEARDFVPPDAISSPDGDTRVQRHVRSLCGDGSNDVRTSQANLVIAVQKLSFGNSSLPGS